MRTSKFNVSNLLSSFNAYNNSFASAIRYIADVAKETEGKIPSSPEKGDKTQEAKQLRKDIKAMEKKNNLIADCKRIVETFAITANDIKSKGIPALRAKIMDKAPFVDENGKAVKFAKLPSYLKSEIKDYANIMQVVHANWIETICAAAENEEGKRVVYNLTIPPVIEEGEITESASGDLVNTKGEIIETESIFAAWNKEATINNIANAAGREKAKETKAELKAAK